LVRRALSAGREFAAPRFHPDRIASGRPWSTTPDEAPAAAYAVLEGICFALRRLIETILPPAGRSRRTAVIGGGSRSELWLDLLAQVLCSPLTRGSGDALLGAAALHLGVPVGQGPSGVVVWKPDPERAQPLEARYRQWLADP
jgi:xylulokinase